VICSKLFIAMMLLGLVWAMMCRTGEAQEAQEPFFEVVPVDTGFPNASVLPGLGKADDGTIYCAFSARQAAIMVMSSKDGGRTWSEPVQAISMPTPGYIVDNNFLCVDDKVTVYATFVPDPSPPYDDSDTLFATSQDGGKTWSEPGEIPIPHNYVCGKVHIPVWLDQNTVVMGYSWEKGADQAEGAKGEGAMICVSGVLISHNRGETWTPGGDVLVAPNITTDEPAIVRLNNGDLFMVCRTSKQRPYETRSHDGGLTWEEPVPSTFYGYNSPSCLLRLGDGAILRCWDNSPRQRYPLVAAISTDECETWSQPRVVMGPTVREKWGITGERACYPSAVQADDGAIVLAWWEQDTGNSRIARFNRAWVEAAEEYSGATVVAFGDSVTNGVRGDGEVTEEQTFRYLLGQKLRADNVEARIINAGIGGNNTTQGLGRIEQDIVARQPDVVIIMFGVNDAAMIDGGPRVRTEPRVALATYRENLVKMIEIIRAAGAKVVLCTPTPMSRAYVYQHLGEYATHDDINYMLRRYAQAAREVATETGVTLVDTFKLFTERPEGLELLQDGCHPGPEGHELIGEAVYEPVRAALASD